MTTTNIAFGPVPSRRLGRSLGINNIPPKHCSYSCVYCQVGPTAKREIVPQAFHAPEAIRQQVGTRLESVRARGEEVDYLTFVPDGEPTLDIDLGVAIDNLRAFDLPIAVISNASLIWREDVRAALARADWVSLKIDSVDEATWRRINRPHDDLKLTRILDGIRQFANDYRGRLVSETMLVEGVNDDTEAMHRLGSFLLEAGIRRSYLAIPLRPPASAGVRGPDENVVNNAYQVVCKYSPDVELLTGYEGDRFAYYGDVEGELLAITAVHPMRKSAVDALLAKAGADWTVVEKLIRAGRLKKVDHAGQTFFMHTLPWMNT